VERAPFRPENPGAFSNAATQMAIMAQCEEGQPFLDLRTTSFFPNAAHCKYHNASVEEGATF